MSRAGVYVSCIYSRGFVLTCECRTSDAEVTITRMLDKVLRRSDALDKESLCIVAGQRVNNPFMPQFNSRGI
jgi:hypothetical protein